MSTESQSEDALVPPQLMLFGTSSPERFKAFGERFVQHIPLVEAATWLSAAGSRMSYRQVPWQDQLPNHDREAIRLASVG